jgi:dihydroneopterin aldolase
VADVIQLRGLRALGVHGVLPEEQARPQPFEVDLDLTVDLRAAGRSDRLDDTVDYGAVAAATTRCIETEQHALLERLAERIAEAALADRRVTAVTVTVRKLRPPLAGAVDHVAVRVSRP